MFNPEFLRESSANEDFINSISSELNCLNFCKLVDKINLSFFYFFLLLVSFLVVPLSAFEVQNIPVQSEGRIKPLDTFARNMLLRFYGKREI